MWIAVDFIPWQPPLIAHSSMGNLSALSPNAERDLSWQDQPCVFLSRLGYVIRASATSIAMTNWATDASIMMEGDDSAVETAGQIRLSGTNAPWALVAP